jgi:creatinine amidohydrolase
MIMVDLTVNDHDNFRKMITIFSSRYWCDCKFQEFEQSRQIEAPLIVLLPLGATEQHGPHLPLCVDNAIVDAITAAMLPRLPKEIPLLVLPTQSIGHSPEHQDFPGTLTFSAQTMLALLTDLIKSVTRSGAKKLILFNAHGGNVGLLDALGREFRASFELLVHNVSWFNLPLFDTNGNDLTQMWGQQEQRFGIHAGALETAIMLAINEGLVDRQKSQNFSSYAYEKSQQFAILGNGRSSKQAWMAQDYNAQGAMGNASAATLEQGVAILDAAAQSLAKLVCEVAKQSIIQPTYKKDMSDQNKP